MNNPFATVPTPAQQPMQANPFAAHVQATPPNFAAPSFPTSAPTANPFASVTQAPPPAPPTQGVAAIQATFAFPATTAVGALQIPPLNPPGEAGLGLQPVAVAPVQVQVEVPTAPAVPQEPAPKARRSRKAKAEATEPVHVDTVYDGATAHDVFMPVVAEQDLDAPTLDSATTEELRDALNARGWNVTLVAS